MSEFQMPDYRITPKFEWTGISISESCLVFSNQTQMCIVRFGIVRNTNCILGVRTQLKIYSYSLNAIAFGLNNCSLIKWQLGNPMSGNGTDHTCPNTELVRHLDVHCISVLKSECNVNVQDLVWISAF